MKDFFSAEDAEGNIKILKFGERYNKTFVGITLETANWLLRKRGKAVHGVLLDTENPNGGWCLTPEKMAGDTHRALLINVEQIEQDSAEAILKELLNAEEYFRKAGGTSLMENVLMRAKALLEKKA